MTKGRTTTVVSIRLPDEDVLRLKYKASKERLTVSEYAGRILSYYIYSNSRGTPRVLDEAKEELWEEVVRESTEDKEEEEKVNPIVERRERYIIGQAPGRYAPGVKSRKKKKKNEAEGGLKVGRNQPCPCGAKHPDGRPKKYKHCCGSTNKDNNTMSTVATIP